MEPSPSGYIYNKIPAKRVQGSLLKKGQKDCKIQRKGEFAVRPPKYEQNKESNSYNQSG